MKFNKLTLIEDSGKRNISGNILYKCLCDCGKYTLVSISNLKLGKTKSCGCFKISNASLPKSVAAMNCIYNRYKYGAKKRKLAFNLNKKQFKNLTSSNCFYCNKPPLQIAAGKFSEKLNGKYFYNGIDRLKSTNGYSIVNCVPCCKLCNFIKRAQNVEEFKEHIKNMYINWAGK